MPAKTAAIYLDRDPREVPAYGLSEAAWILRMHPATLRSWISGRAGSAAPLIATPADRERSRLSFNNLVEAHVLRALRSDHAVSLQAVRRSIDYAQAELGISRLLLNEDLETSAGELFLEHYGRFINLSRSGQLAIRRILKAYLRRVERDDMALPIRFFPLLPAGVDAEGRTVVVDPRVGFGRPLVAGTGISTRAIAQRIDAGEPEDLVAEDYGLQKEQIETGLLFERAA